MEKHLLCRHTDVFVSLYCHLMEFFRDTEKHHGDFLTSIYSGSETLEIKNLSCDSVQGQNG